MSAVWKCSVTGKAYKSLKELEAARTPKKEEKKEEPKK